MAPPASRRAHVSRSAPRRSAGTDDGAERDDSGSPPRSTDRQGADSCDSFQNRGRGLRAHLDEKLEGPVTLDLFLEPIRHRRAGRPECELCEDTRDLLEDVASLSDRITLTVHDIRTQSDLARDTASPCPNLRLASHRSRRRPILGIPAGLEFGDFSRSRGSVARDDDVDTGESNQSHVVDKAGSCPGA